MGSSPIRAASFTMHLSSNWFRTYRLSTGRSEFESLEMHYTPVAQPAEHTLDKGEVVGASPTWGTSIATPAAWKKSAVVRVYMLTIA